MQFSITSFLSTGVFAAICLSGAIASPVANLALEVRDTPQTNPLNRCWAPGNTAPDRNVVIPSGHVCTKAWARGPGNNETAIESFNTLSLGKQTNYGQLDFSDNQQTVGPWHCCYRCAQDNECVGWKIDLNSENLCHCQLVKVKSCASTPAVSFTEQLTIGNSSSIYHPSSGTCRLH